MLGEPGRLLAHLLPQCDSLRVAALAVVEAAQQIAGKPAVGQLRQHGHLAQGIGKRTLRPKACSARCSRASCASPSGNNAARNSSGRVSSTGSVESSCCASSGRPSANRSLARKQRFTRARCTGCAAPRDRSAARLPASAGRPVDSEVDNERAARRYRRWPPPAHQTPAAPTL